MADQTRTVAKEDLVEAVGELTLGDPRPVEGAIRVQLGLR